MKYKCEMCGAVMWEKGKLCSNCGGNIFKKLNEFTLSHDDDVYTDTKGDEDNG